MQKLMFALAALATGVTLAADQIVSANVVGYCQQDYKNREFVGFSVGFQNVGNEGVFKWSDLKPTSFEAGSDTLQFLEPVLARTQYTFCAYEGQWYVVDGEDWTPVSDDDQFDVGTGFLADFASKNVNITVSGSVLNGPTAMDFTGKEFVMVGNPLPRAVKLSEIEVGFWETGSDTLQRLEPTLARTANTYLAYDGDWYEDVDGEYALAGDAEFAVGESMLADFASKKVKITFPSAY